MTRILDTAAVGALIGVNGDTIRKYVSHSRPSGGRYSHHPFPSPHARIGLSPYWLEEQVPEILAWHAKRPGRGHGGGPKRTKEEAK